jgi:hypothetical protein
MLGGVDLGRIERVFLEKKKNECLPHWVEET